MPGELHGRQWPASGYTHGVSHRITPIDPHHPICAGVEDGFEIVDEIYLNPVFEDQVVPLLRSDFEMKSKNFYSGELAIRGRMYESDGWTHPDGSGLRGMGEDRRLEPDRLPAVRGARTVRLRKPGLPEAAREFDSLGVISRISSVGDRTSIGTGTRMTFQLMRNLSRKDWDANT